MAVESHVVVARDELPRDSISSLAITEAHGFPVFAASSWDTGATDGDPRGGCYVYKCECASAVAPDIPFSQRCAIRQILKEPAPVQTPTRVCPVLDCCFSPDGKFLYGGRCDGSFSEYNLEANQSKLGMPTNFLTADEQKRGVQAIRSFFSQRAGCKMVVTAGWDGSLNYWDMRQQTPLASVALGIGINAMDVTTGTSQFVTVATADDNILVYDLAGDIQTPVLKYSPGGQGGARNNSLHGDGKHPGHARCLTTFPDASGFAVGSTTSRVGIFYFAEDTSTCEHNQVRKECKRCQDFVYFVNKERKTPINSIAFQDAQRFVTGACDVEVKMWDKAAKSKVKSLQAVRPGRDVEDSVVACHFVRSAAVSENSLLLSAVSNVWNDGGRSYKREFPNCAITLQDTGVKYV